MAGNLETAPGSAQLEVVFDRTPPQSSCLVNSYVSFAPIEVQLQAIDATTEPAQIALDYRFRQPGGGWQPDWTETGQFVEGAEGVLQFDAAHGQNRW